MLGQYRHVIALPEDYAMKKLKIRMTATENGSMTGIDRIAIGNCYDKESFWFNRSMILCLSGFMCLSLALGILLVVVGWLSEKSYFMQTNMLGLIFAASGIYFLCRGRVMDVLIPNELIYNKMEYISLYAIPIPLILFSIEVIDKTKHKWRETFFKFTACFYSIFFVTVIILSQMKIVHLCSVLNLQLVLFSLILILLMNFYIEAAREPDSTPWMHEYLLGVVFLIIGAFISILAYRGLYIPQVNNIIKLWKFYNNIVPLSLITCIIFFSKGITIRSKSIIGEIYKNKYFKEMAYTDPLTRLSNRLKLQKSLEVAEEQGIKNIAVISIDLNELKTINDNLGHEAGDRLLTSFADILEFVTDDNISSYRVGGDEFIILALNTSDCKFIIEKINRYVNEFNATDKEFRISYAYGIAWRHEFDLLEEVFYNADKRMYENKAEIKSTWKNGYSGVLVGKEKDHTEKTKKDHSN